MNYLFATLLAVCLSSIGYEGSARGQTLLYKDYRGTIDTSKIGLYVGPAIKGKIGGYYFRFGDLKDHLLLGDATNSRQFVLYDKDAAGNIVSTFRLTRTTSNGKTITGTWTPRNGKALNVRLTLAQGGVAQIDSYNDVHRVTDFGNPYKYAEADSKTVEPKINAFYTAVIKGDQEAVANSISYPFRYNTSRTKHVTYKDKAALLKSYKTIFSASFLKKLKTDVPHDLLATGDGLSMAKGLVWFDKNGLAYAVNKP